MHSAVTIVVLVAAAHLCSARPDLGPMVGFSTATDLSRPDYYSFSTGNKTARTADGRNLHLSYTAVLARHVHSIDAEMTIESLTCFEDSIEVEVTTSYHVAKWGRHFLVVASPQWGCAEGAVIRRITGVSWNNLTATMNTTAATYNDVFLNATIRYEVVGETEEEQQKRKDITLASNILVAGWNANAAGGATKSPIVWWGATCASCATNKAAAPALCALCPKGVSLTAGITCTDCYARSAVDSVNLNVEFSLSKLVKLTLSADASAAVHIGEAGISLGGNVAFDAQIPLYAAPTYGLSFYVGPVHVNLGLNLGVTAVLSASASANAHAGIGFSKTAKLHIEASSASSGVSLTTSVTDTGSAPKANYGVSANLAGSVGLRVGASVGLQSLANIEAYVQPTVLASAGFLWPAYAAKSTAGKIGPCGHPHLVEWSTDFKVLAHVGATVDGHTWAPTIAPLYSANLASGCLFDTTAGASAIRTWSLSNTLNNLFPGLSNEAIKSGLASEIAAVLGVSDSTITVTFSGQQITVMIADGSGNAQTKGTTIQTLLRRAGSALSSKPMFKTVYNAITLRG